MTLGELAVALGCELTGGDANALVAGVATIQDAGPSEVTFLANLRYAPKVSETRAVAVIAGEPLRNTSAATLVSSNPYHDFARALSLFHPLHRPAVGIHPTAVIASTARIGADAYLGAYAVVDENAIIGDRATIHPHAVIYHGCVIGDDFTAHSHVSVRERTRIGNRVTLHNGVVIGGDGFGFAKTSSGTQFKIPQTGSVVLEDDVEVQTLTSIDRAAMGETRIKRGAKIDSLCQVGHGCTVGEDNIICGQTGLAGSTVLEKNVIMAAQTGSAGHLTIRENAIVWAQSGLHSDVEAGAIVAGSPAFDSRNWLRTAAALPKLPDALRALRVLERRVALLEKTAAAEKA